jgi:hypothetical protein
MAIQCSTDQDVIDIVIPVVLCKNIWEEKLDESKLTAILVQVKNRTGKQRVRIDETLINKQQGFFPQPATGDSDKRPYITIVMNLEAEDTRRSPNELPVYSRASSRQKFEHPRFPIYVNGCSSSVYAVVEDNAIYSALLGNQDILAEHSRPELRPQAARMKPFWKPGEDSYHWIDEAKLKGTPPEDDGIEMVLVGPAATADDGLFEEGKETVFETVAAIGTRGATKKTLKRKRT